MGKRNVRKGTWIGKAALGTAVLLAAFFGTKKLLPLLTERKETVERTVETQYEVESIPQTEIETAVVNGQMVIDMSGEEEKTEIITVNTEEIPDANSRYLAANLSADLKEDFAELYRACASFENFCLFPVPISKEDVGLLMTLLHTECPELFQNDSTQTYHMELVGGQVRSVTIPYSMSHAEYEEKLAKCQSEVDRIVTAARQKDSAYEQELEAYRLICEDCEYDQTFLHAGDASGVLLDRKGKCDGISLAFKWVMDELEIPCIVIAADSRDGSQEGHAWNVVKIEGVWCIVDATQDCNAGNRSILCYPAFDVREDLFMRDYSYPAGFGELGIPACTSNEKNYHVRNGSFICAGEEKEGFFRAMDQAKAAGGMSPAQFETDEGWALFQENSSDWAAQWMQSNGLYGNSSYLAIDTYRTIQVNVEINENSGRMQEINRTLDSMEGQIEDTKTDLTVRKESIGRMADELEDIKAAAEELQAFGSENWPEEQFEEYNGLVSRYDTLREDYRQASQVYNELVEQYRTLCDTYNALVQEYNALSG